MNVTAQFSGFLFLMLYVVAMLRPVAPYLEYAIHQDYISEVLCINKDKPELDCEGVCHLNQRLQESQNQGQKSTTPELPVKMQDYPLSLLDQELSENPIRKHDLGLTVYQNLYAYSMLSGVFHPPQMT